MDKLLSDKELFELCKEVFKLEPKWTTNEAIFRLGERIWVSDHESIPVFESNENYKTKYLKKLNIGEEPKEPYEVAPLYTSDYLLEKLPAATVLHKNKGTGQKGSKGYSARVHGTTDTYASDTPLKSLLKLTIALSEAGELK